MTEIRPRPRRSGFSLIELMVASVSASILALTAAAMLVFAWRGWQDLQRGIAMQGDASFAMSRMKSQLRQASAASVRIGSNGGRVEFAEPGPLAVTQAFYRVANGLVHDRDVGAGDRIDPLIAGGTLHFSNVLSSATIPTLRIHVTLTGDVARDATTYIGEVSFRHE